jgi:hypothetical protein
MTFPHRLTCLIVAALAAGCAQIYGVQHDFDRQYDFSGLRTYDWMAVPEKSGMNTLVVQRVQRAVNAELQARGYILAREGPDFLIAEHIGSKDKVQVENWGYGYGPWGGHWGANRVSVYQYEEGSLILDFVDARSKKMFWRGVAKAEVDRIDTPEKSEQLINEAVQKILEAFPP